jgi:agmatinase
MRTTFASWPACDGPSANRAPVGVLGAPHATPYRPGEASHSAGAPKALREVLTGYSGNREHYDFDIGGFLPADVEDCGDVPGDPTDPEGNRNRITTAVRTLLENGAVPVVLGGDDSVPIPVFRAFEGRGPLTVVQVDAHLDWRDEVRGERYGWSSPMRRASEMPWIRHMIQVGLRGIGSARAGEVADARAWGVEIVTAEEVHRAGVARAIGLVPAGVPCLVTVDCDGLDPSIMPAVMAPAPGGLTYWHVIELIRGVAAKARIAGFDLVEFVPERDFHGLAARTAARIACNAVAAIAAGPGFAASRGRPVADAGGA